MASAQSYRAERPAIGRFEAALAVLFAGSIVLSVFADRQLVADGAYFVIRSLENPDWFPQPTPRRFFAVMWTTWAARLVGLIDPTNVKLAALLFGAFAFSQVIIPVVVIARSALDATVKYLLLAAFLASTLLLSNFVVSESLFALALTTMFVVYTFDADADASYLRRAILAGLLVASYEVVVISNVFLLLATLQARRSRHGRDYYYLAVVLLALALPFQALWMYVKLEPGVSAGYDPFVYVLTGILCAIVMAAVMFFKLAERSRVLSRAVIVIAFVLPVSLLLFPDIIHFRSNFFRMAYPSRVFTLGGMCCIALLPVLLNGWFGRFTRPLVSWYGPVAMRNTALTIAACYCSVSVLCSVDFMSFREALREQLDPMSRSLAYNDCSFCRNPESFGVIAPLEEWAWEPMSLTIAMAEPDGEEPAIIVTPGHIFSSVEIPSFFSHRIRIPRAKEHG